MPQPPIAPWTSRTFPSGLPVSLFRPTLERVRGTPARLESYLTKRLPVLLTRKPEHGWSIQTHAGHLLQLEPLWAKRLAELVGKATDLSPADMKNRATEDAGYDDMPIGDILDAFRITRSALVAGFESLDEAQLTHAAHHPRLHQPMSAIDLAFFVAEHDDHHVAHMTEMLAT